ncbi:ABC transporter ATP-binding protein, partial [Mammaliicoccus sciuri]|nr:ABC transporter ATP-binding protein [Mammaliicoccus sciuri]
ILKWATPYRSRMILGFVMSFINSIFIALPIYLAAQVFNRVLSHKQIEMYEIMSVLGIMILLVLARFVTAYLKNRLQESIAYEMSAKERLN